MIAVSIVVAVSKQATSIGGIVWLRCARRTLGVLEDFGILSGSRNSKAFEVIEVEQRINAQFFWSPKAQMLQSVQPRPCAGLAQASAVKVP